MGKYGGVLGGLLVLMLGAAAAGWAQADPSKLLIGRCNGEAQTSTGSYDRTLVITSVEVRNGQFVAAHARGARDDQR